jgi:hypothetical protein
MSAITSNIARSPGVLARRVPALEILDGVVKPGFVRLENVSICSLVVKPRRGPRRY